MAQDDYGDLTQYPRELVVIDHIKHVIAKISLLVTGGTLVTWLVNIDLFLRLVLTGIGIVAGIYSLLYYRKAWKRLQ